MKNTSKTIIFFGTEDFSLTVLTGLIEAGYTIASVVTKPDSKKGRGQKILPPPVKVLANRHNIAVWQPSKLSEIDDRIKEIDNPIGILVSYGKIIPQTTIDKFNPGIVNVHPSLLPKYRGPTPIESAIKNGDQTTGVSIMQLSAAMDAGPVYSSKEYPLKGTETRPELYHTLAELGTDLLLETLPKIIEGTLHPTPQHEEAATYCQLLKKSDAKLDLNNLNAKEAEQIVRAHLGFPKSKLTYRDRVVIVTRAHVIDTQETTLDFKCKDGRFLSVDELIAPSGRLLKREDFLRGYAA